MRNTTTTPAVYVGTYHKYNCGSIYGKWFDLTEFDGREEFYEACQALHADEWDAEFIFQDRELVTVRLRMFHRLGFLHCVQIG